MKTKVFKNYRSSSLPLLPLLPFQVDRKGCCPLPDFFFSKREMEHSRRLGPHI